MTAEARTFTGIRGERPLLTQSRLGSRIKRRAYQERSFAEDKADKRSTTEIVIGGNCLSQIAAVIETIRWAKDSDSINLEAALFSRLDQTPTLPYSTTTQNTENPSLLLTGEPILIISTNTDRPLPTTPEVLIKTVVEKLHKWNVVSPPEGKSSEDILNEISETLKARREAGETKIEVPVPLGNDLVLFATVVNPEIAVFSLSFTKEGYQKRKEGYQSHREAHLRAKPVKHLELANITPQDLALLNVANAAGGVMLHESQIVDGFWPYGDKLEQALAKKGWVPAVEENEAILEELGLKKTDVLNGLLKVYRPEKDTDPTDLVITVDKRGDKITIKALKSQVEAKAASERLDIKLLTDASANFRQRHEKAKKLVGETIIMTPRIVLSEVFKENNIKDPTRLSRLLPYAYRLLQLTVGQDRQPIYDSIENQLRLYDPQQPAQTLRNESYVNRSLAEDWQIWVGGDMHEGVESRGGLPELQLYLRGMRLNSELTSVNLVEINRVVDKTLK